MLLPSWLGGRYVHGGRATNSRNRHALRQRLRVERLEDRLPPGDAALAGLLAGDLIPHAERATGLMPVEPDTRPASSRSLAEFASLDAGTTFTLLSADPATSAAAARVVVSDVDEPFAPSPVSRRAAARPSADPAPVAAAVPNSERPAWCRSCEPVFATPAPPSYQLDLAVGALAMPALEDDELPPADLDDGGGVMSAGVRALFDLGQPTTGPFPANVFTVPDRTHNTGRRVNLPFPDCQVYVSDCEDITVLNELDGFNLQPRLSIPFSGPIDVDTVTSETVFLVSLGTTVPGQGYMPRGTVVGINQVVWDVATNALHVESDALLAQHTRFALIVTNGIRDDGGDRVEASPEFRRFRQTVAQPYRGELLDAIHEARRLGVRERDIVTASVFTTQSATAILEKIRDQIHATTPEPADFLLGPGGTRTVFALDDVTSLMWNQHVRHNPDEFNPVSLATELTALRDLIPGAVGHIAYGRYSSPEYVVHPGEFIPSVGTLTGTPQVQSMMDVHFNVVLPSGSMPPNGWPVAIYGTGQEGSKDTWSLRVAASNASRGIATVSTDYYGRGFGPLSTITVESSMEGPVTFLSGGRSVDQLGDGSFGDGFGGLRALNPMIGIRDALRQTTADWMQLVRVIQVGVDVDGDGVPDFDPSRIDYFGNSQGGMNGVIFMAVEPDVHVGVINAVAGSQNANTRLSSARGALWGTLLAARSPSLINGPGITSIDGVATSGPAFHENMPPRGGVPLSVGLADGTSAIIRSPVINTVQGAMAIQEVMERREWLTLSGDQLAYAPHLKRSPLAGVPAKSLIVQFGKGDRNQTNPATTALLRAGDLADRSTFFRHDLFFAENPTVDRNPHQFLIRVTGHPMERQIALGYQSQIAAFFASDGQEIIHPEPERFFEVPIKGPLPEDLNYIP